MAVIAIILLAWPIFAQAPDPAREAERAQALVAAGKLDEAIRIYQDLVRNSPENPVLLLNLCVAEYTGKRYREAAATAAAALKLDPDLLPARLFLGASKLELGDLPGAIESLKIVVAANPRERNGRLMLGSALLQAGQPAAAVEHLEAAAEMLPASTRAWYGLGRAREMLGRMPAAKDAWERLMALPASFESHLHAAEVHSAEQRWREAAVEWREALRLAPEKPAIRVGLGEALFRSRDYQAVHGHAETAPRQRQRRGTVPLRRIASESPTAARRGTVLARSHCPGRSSAAGSAALGQALLQTGKAGEAIPLLEAAVSADRDGSIHFQLFRAYQLTHRDAEAKRALADYQRFRASLPARP